MFEDIQFVEISSAYEQVNNIQRCIVAVKGATDAQLSILDDLIQSKRKQVGQYHELSEKAHLPKVSRSSIARNTKGGSTMKTITYNKLVRDNIPDIIRENGDTCKTKTVTGEELRTALREKLCEEVAEFLADESLEELADILEVIHALSVDLGASPDRLDEICAEKYIERGGFEKGIMLLSTTEKE